MLTTLQVSHCRVDGCHFKTWHLCNSIKQDCYSNALVSLSIRLYRILDKDTELRTLQYVQTIVYTNIYTNLDICFKQRTLRQTICILDIFIEKSKTHDSKNNLTLPFSCKRLNTDCNIKWVKHIVI